MADAASSSSSPFSPTPTTSTSAAATSSSAGSLSDAVSATLTATLSAAASASASAVPKPGEGIELLPGNPVVNFILGLLVITASSIANSFGLNLMQFDHLRTKSLAPQPPEYTRPLWLAGLGSYLASQLFGSTLALRYLRAEYCAPLSSSSLVFNFLFARWLLGTPVTKRDIQGTGLIILGVVLIVILGSINSGLSTSITLDRLYRLWARPAFLAYLVLQAIALFGGWLLVLHLGLLADERISDEDVIEEYLIKPPHKRFPRFKLTLAVYARYTALERMVATRLSSLVGHVPDALLRFYVGIGWAAVGGAMSGASLVLAKATVMIGLGPESNVYWRPTPILTIILLALTAVLQMIALNRGLKAYSSTVVVPVFYAGYTLLGFANSMVFLDQIGAYSWVVLFFLAVSVGILLGGVVFLSSDKDPPGGPNAAQAETTPSSPTPSHATALTARRGTRARAGSASASIGAAEEGRALFDADEEGRQPVALGDDVNEGGGKWELGDSDEEDEASEQRRKATGASNPWDEDEDGRADAGEKDPIVHRS